MQYYYYYYSSITSIIWLFDWIEKKMKKKDHKWMNETNNEAIPNT